MPEIEDITMEDALAGLEGETAPEYEASVGIDEGTYPVKITEVKFVKTSFTDRETGAEVFINKARVMFEIDHPRYPGWERHLDLSIGKNDKGEWRDAGWKSSVRRVLGDAAYNAQLAPITDAKRRYEKAASLLPGREARVVFKKNPRSNNPDVAWPSGSLLAPEAAAAVSGGATL